MAGSLWRQRLDSTTAMQLTDGPGYDYQPDWSPDGRSIVYASYNHDAIELRIGKRMQQNGVDSLGRESKPGKAQNLAWRPSLRARDPGGKGLKRSVASQVRKQVIDLQITQEQVYAS